MARKCEVCERELCFVHCVYCGEPVGDDAFTESGTPHSPICPTVTGLYPVRQRDVECPGECGCVRGLLCAECDVELVVGDLYALLPLDEDGRGVEVACLGCAALGVVTTS